jgi:hypothetical protein
VTVYTIDRGTGRITATATLTAARQLVALLAAETEFGQDWISGPVFYPMSQSNQPSLPRFAHSQVWTGSKLIIWGGAKFGSRDRVECYGDGGIYDPALDTWSPVSPVNAPSPRRGHSAVWTGSEMIVWGGMSSDEIEYYEGDTYFSSQVYEDGAIYNPSSQSWRPMAAAPMGLHGHTAVWTGTEMIVWGDASMSSNTGMAYNPQSNSWRYISSAGAPSPRMGHAALWTGDAMVIWGGSDDWESDGTTVGTGAFYYPSTDSWVSISQSGAPAGGDGRWAGDGERGVELMWTGSKLIAVPINTYGEASQSWIQAGGIYDPVTRNWQRVETTGAPNSRPYMAVWNGYNLVVAGSSGNDFAGLDYNFNTRRWTEAVRARTGSFQGRIGTWAPELNELLIFGGMHADGSSTYSGGSFGKRGFRLRLKQP